MGARFRGNIAALCDIAAPARRCRSRTSGWPTSACSSGREGVARTKGELLEALPAGRARRARCRRRLHARAPGAARVRRCCSSAVPATIAPTSRQPTCRLDDELRARFELRTPWGTVPVRLELRGEHQVTNALMAAAVAGRPGRARRRCRRGAGPGYGGTVAHGARAHAGRRRRAERRLQRQPGVDGGGAARPRPARDPGPARRGAGRDARARRRGRRAARAGRPARRRAGDRRRGRGGRRRRRGRAGRPGGRCHGRVEVVEVGDAAGARVAVLARVGPETRCS